MPTPPIERGLTQKESLPQNVLDAQRQLDALRAEILASQRQGAELAATEARADQQVQILNDALKSRDAATIASATEQAAATVASIEERLVIDPTRSRLESLKAGMQG
ncbi:MAG: hypothetical protein G01um101425_534 [Candidatus Peregrinibacteria bacterium Gr01-1014_25]|nr:MAG: hypothetical protein G01um101425_534 [Candidatus Peregrinibacteria bacterium Gr01-1014_25]